MNTDNHVLGGKYLATLVVGAYSCRLRLTCSIVDTYNIGDTLSRIDALYYRNVCSWTDEYFSSFLFEIYSTVTDLIWLHQ